MRKLTIVLIFLLTDPGTIFSQVSIKDTEHNISVSGPGAIKAESEQAVCAFCHTPHKSATTAQLWNREQPSSAYTLYSSDFLTSKGYPSPSQINEKSKLCMGCHDGTIAIGSVYNTPGSGTSGSITMAGGVTTMPSGAGGHIGTVLTDDHPVGYSYDTVKDPELVSTRSWPWGTSVKLDPDASNGKVECHTCHDPHDNQYSKFLRMSNTDAALCTFCHNKTGWNTAVHNSSTQSYTPPGGSATTIGEWACRNCHKPHGGAGVPYILKSQEESTCYDTGCHGTTAPATTIDIETVANKTFRHPINTTSGVHVNPEDVTNMSNRHAECPDCHQLHEAEDGTHDGTSRTLSGVLKGVWGLEPSPWPAASTTMINNDNTFSIPSAGTYVVRNPATSEYQICLKCHSNATTQPIGQRNMAAEINPNYPSYHGIVAGGTSNPYVDSQTTNEPWGTNKIVWCSDCHSSNTASDGKGPHGSNLDNILVETITSSSTTGTPLCFVCHKETNYWTGQIKTRYDKHPGEKGNHKRPNGCFACHMYDYSDYPGYGGNSGKIFVHGQNKRFYYNEWDGSVSPFKQMADAFVNGYMADIDFVNQECWSESKAGSESKTNCGKAHDAQSYSVFP